LRDLIIASRFYTFSWFAISSKDGPRVVVSAGVRAVGYNEETSTLAIEFFDSSCQHAPVSVEFCHGLKNSLRFNS